MKSVPGPDPRLAPAGRIRDLSTLNRGVDIMALHQDGVSYTGTVDDVAAGQGVVWIKEHVLGERKLLHEDDYSFWILPHRE